ncbi:hypothetical protein [Acidihalobacter prosperus]|uniref:Uncharacterized protein n=1 Tax=Acidihalobacter prosperus TaxID=160660 RepID=A0A1A6C334_9GAMM|nr:hypothetical protein [Acidihalobacter prosperus]OBS08966.1 hypothetical protein Thpro_022083 [Acidihalobacter prosperus]
MQNAILRVTLKTPVAIGRNGLSLSVLDALVFDRLVLMHGGDEDAAMKDMALVLDRIDDHVWACGGGYYNRGLHGSLPWRRLVFRKMTADRHLQSMAEDLCGITPERWPYEVSNLFGQQVLAMQFTQRFVNTPEILFRMRGNPEAIARLLQVRDYLGPGHAIGFGQIESVEWDIVENVDDAWLLLDPDGRLTRPIPAALQPLLDASKTALVSEPVRCNPPYWRGNTEPGFRPVPIGL